VDGGLLDFARGAKISLQELKYFMTPPDLTGLTRDKLLERAQTWSLGEVWGSEAENLLMGSYYVNQDGTVSPRLDTEAHHRLAEAAWEYNFQELVQLIQCSVLVLATDHPHPPNPLSDRIRAAKVEATDLLRHYIPGAEIVWMLGAHHNVPVHRPRETVDAVLGFLQRNLL